MPAPNNPALALLAQGIADVVGAKSEIYRDILRAVESDQYVDIMLAQVSFDALSAQTKRDIAERVTLLVGDFVDRRAEEEGAVSP